MFKDAITNVRWDLPEPPVGYAGVIHQIDFTLMHVAPVSTIVEWLERENEDAAAVAVKMYEREWPEGKLLRGNYRLRVFYLITGVDKVLLERRD